MAVRVNANAARGRFWDICLPRARIMMQPKAQLIATWMPRGHAGRSGASGFSAGVVRAFRTANAECVARIYSNS